MTADDVGDIKMDESDSPLKQEDCPMLASTVIYDSMRGQMQGTSGHHFTNTVENTGLEQCGISLSGLEPPCGSAQSTQQTGNVVRDLNIGKYKDTVLDVGKFTSSKDVLHSRKGHWPHLYQLVGGPKHKGFLGDPISRAKDKLMVSVRQNSRRGNVDTWHLRHLKTKHIDETGRICVDVMNGKNLNSESALLPQDARLKILSTSSFSHFFVKKTPKGKGVICGHLGDKTDLEIGGNLQSNGRMFSTISMPSGAEMENLQHGSSGIPIDSNCSGVNLREWLKLRYHVKNKVESLNFFKQIAELVNLAHSQGVVLQHLRPSYFILTPLNKLKYVGSSTQINLGVPMSLARCKKRLPEEDIGASCTSYVKQQKVVEGLKFHNHPPSATLLTGAMTATLHETNYDIGCSSGSCNTEHKVLSTPIHEAAGLRNSPLSDLQLEERWYACPGEVDGKSCKFSSNIYSLGVLLFELLCSLDCSEAHSAAMFDIHDRILPPLFLSESPKEAGFCLWLIHPDPSSRPSIREVLLSDLFCKSQESHSSDELTMSANDDDTAESELLLDFLGSLKEKKQDQAVKLVEDIKCIEADIKGLEGKHLSTASPVQVKRDYNIDDFMKSVARSGRNENRLINDISQLEKAYFSMRSQTSAPSTAGRPDRDLLKNRETWSHVQKQNEMLGMNRKSASGLDIFFEGLCKFACHSKFELRGSLRNGDLFNSANVICSLSFDRDEEYIAVAGASKRIKIFEFSALVNDTIDIHYPVIEMGNKSKLSCVSWNSYIKNYLAATDYDGVVQVWDASTGVGYSQHMEHQKRAWSVDFSRADPTKLASGSDDCSVKLWCTNEKRSTCTIWSPANVCCVQFSPYSSHLLMFGSADHKIYGYDLRHMRIPWCTLAGHEKTVSYVKFIDPETLVSASTDNTIKLWDLSKTSLSGMSSDACPLTFSGHTNTKHFVGLSVWDGYIACGSESNEVFTYCRSLPMPITSYKFSPINPLSRDDVGDDDGLFVSSVCWRSRSNMILAANSGGSIRLLQLV